MPIVLCMMFRNVTLYLIINLSKQKYYQIPSIITSIIISAIFVTMIILSSVITFTIIKFILLLCLDFA